jgi:hypothetical protein
MPRISLVAVVIVPLPICKKVCSVLVLHSCTPTAINGVDKLPIDGNPPAFTIKIP